MHAVQQLYLPHGNLFICMYTVQQLYLPNGNYNSGVVLCAGNFQGGFQQRGGRGGPGGFRGGQRGGRGGTPPTNIQNGFNGRSQNGNSARPQGNRGKGVYSFYYYNFLKCY